LLYIRKPACPDAFNDVPCVRALYIASLQSSARGWQKECCTLDQLLYALLNEPLNLLDLWSQREVAEWRFSYGLSEQRKFAAICTTVAVVDIPPPPKLPPLKAPNTK
jgi:hypothetical protein